MRRFICLLMLPVLAACTHDLGVANYAIVVHEKYNHLKCPEIKAQMAGIDGNIKRLEGLQAKAGQSSVGSFVGATTYGPELTEAHGNLRILRQTYATKNCDAAPKT
ncbi:hypothetical protein GJW-30_1_01786 [Variibacter gotjawalensis]|uniref:Lipoprotein n=1 Tax=Variibacter gotjawalensis TaxID=1333996 RepID=A0A0S3PTG1_9BRAD|nr:hypothetical protein [Variibacter gotjawalensis]NIK49571.1 hypothetical protein [Variibacter gotjawalensis]RZS45582.1 hypothetical protein EV661_3901 [Variibacter gotjawalensis]BAT59255.1 hypothetical protein GJW-30_1_01786 [Variibacter gotjawalensis]